MAVLQRDLSLIVEDFGANLVKNEAIGPTIISSKTICERRGKDIVLQNRHSINLGAVLDNPILGYLKDYEKEPY